MSPLGTSATTWPIVRAPDDGFWWVWSIRWKENWQGKPKYSEETCLSVTLSIKNPTWPDLGPNPGRRGGKPVTNRPSYGTDLVDASAMTSFASIIHRLTCNTTFHKPYHLLTGLQVFKIHNMFRPTWPSSGVKNTSNEEIAAFPCCWCICSPSDACVCCGWCVMLFLVVFFVACPVPEVAGLWFESWEFPAILYDSIF
jgi:hypothetical protein